MSVGGEAHLQCAGLTVQGASLVIDRYCDGDVARRCDGPGREYRYRRRHDRCGRRHVLFVDLRRRRDRFDVDRMLDAHDGRP